MESPEDGFGNNGPNMSKKEIGNVKEMSIYDDKIAAFKAILFIFQNIARPFIWLVRQPN